MVIKRFFAHKMFQINRVRNSIAQVLDDGNPVLQGSSKGIILWRSFPDDDETARSFDLSSAVPHLCGRNGLFPRKSIACLFINWMVYGQQS
jgi:hypothetical protein